MHSAYANRCREVMQAIKDWRRAAHCGRSPMGKSVQTARRKQNESRGGTFPFGRKCREGQGRV